MIINYGKKHKSIFCGDVPYKALEAKIWNDEYYNLVVPHHGCEMDADLVKTVTGGGTAVYCRDKDSKTNHISKLDSKNYTVEKTEDAGRNFLALKM